MHRSASEPTSRACSEDREARYLSISVSTHCSCCGCNLFAPDDDVQQDRMVKINEILRSDVIESLSLTTADGFLSRSTGAEKNGNENVSVALEPLHS